MQELLNSIDTLSALSAALDIFAALVAGMLLIACVLESGHRHRVTRYFMAILAVHVVLLSCDAGVWFFNGIPEQEGIASLLLLLAVDLSSYAALALFTCFISAYIEQFTPVSPWVPRIACSVCAVFALLWLGATIFGESAYSMGDEGKFVAGLLYGAGAASV